LNGPSGGSRTPVQIVTATHAPVLAQNVAGTYDHYCVTTTSAGALCWGYNDAGELGNGSTGEISPTPVEPKGLGAGAGVVDVAAGTFHSCAVTWSATSGGSAKCWGGNQSGQLGDLSDASSLTPVPVWSGALTSPKSITAGYIETCAVNVNGAVYCWGDDKYGELGIGTANSLMYSWPQPVHQATGAYSSLSVGNGRACERVGTSVDCWGSLYPQPPDTTPTLLGTGSDPVSAVSTADMTCWGTTTGHVTCVDVQGNYHAVW
jgi:Regulator of chromosome condensation (RCC1) repeat